MVGNTNYLFLTTKDHLAIAQAEIGCNSHPLEKGLFLTTQAPQHPASAFGYTKSIWQVLALQRQLDISALSQYVQPDYKIELYDFTQSNTTTKQFADQLYQHVSPKRVNLSTPTHTYALFILKETYYFAQLHSSNTDQPALRKAHQKIHLHPTSLDPRLAKAMIRLAKADSFHDPFCGVGGIVIEGALQGLTVSGSDIVEELINKAKENAFAYRLSCDFFVQDALTLEKKSPAFIADLPYGKNSALSTDKQHLYQQFLLHAQTLTTTLVLGMEESTKIDSLLKQTSWKKQQEFTLYVHKSLSRKIVVLTGATD